MTTISPREAVTPRGTVALRLSGAIGALAMLVAAIALVGAPTAGAATARPAATCKTVVRGAPWKIKGLGSGSTYHLAAHGLPCATASAWVVKFSHQTATSGALKGPSGYRCDSLASKGFGDSHVYSGECQKGTPATALFIWAPKP